MSSPGENSVGEQKQPGIDAVKNAMGNLLDNTETQLDFPSQSSSNAKASSRLHYQVYGHLSAQLDTDWEIFPGFTLNGVRLDVEAFYDSDADKSLSVHLEASCTVAGCSLVVEGDLPDLRTSSDIDFILTLTVKDRHGAISPEKLTTGLSGSEGKPMNFSAVTESLDQDVASKLTSPGRGFALKASITIHRTAGGKFFVREISVIFQAQLNWTPVDSLNLTDIGISVRAYRESADSGWDFGLILRGQLLVNQKIPASVVVKIIVGNVSRAELTVSVGQWSGLTADVFLDALVPHSVSTGGTIVTAINDIPPSLPGNDRITESMSSPLSASIVIEKNSTTGWGIASIDLSVAMPGFTWSPIDEDSVSLRDLSFELHVGRKAKSTAATVSTGSGSWDFRGSVGAVLSMRRSQFLIPVCISYDSKTKITEIRGTLQSGSYGQLNVIATDPSINPSDGEYVDLIGSAEKNPAPDESPLPLSNISMARSGEERGLLLCFNATTLTRARFKADYAGGPGKSWQITDDLAIKNLGIMFDVKNPRDEKTRKISGYVYGKAKVGDKTELFAFIAGMSSKEATEFWVGFSVDYDPDGSLGAEATAVISDNQFAGTEASAPDSAKWDVQNFPVKPDSVLRSIHAKLLVKFVKDKTGVASGESSKKTRLSQIQVRFDAEGKWPICDDLSLTGAHLNVLVDRREKGGYDWSVELFGMVEKNGYQVGFMANVAHDSETTTFEVQVVLKKIDDTSKAVAASPAVVTEVGLFGKAKPADSELDGQIPGKCPPFIYLFTITPHLLTSQGESTKLTKAVETGDYPIQPNALINTSNTSIKCSALVEKAKGGKYSFNTLTFKLILNDAWRITSNIVLERAALELAIQDLTGKRKAVLAASGLLKIGDIVPILVSLKFSTGGELNLKITTGTASDLLEALVDVKTSQIVPHSFPATGSRDIPAEFALDLTCKSKPGGGGWLVRSVKLALHVNQEWHVGDIVIRKLRLHANFERNLSSDAWKKEISITGEIAIGQTTVAVRVAMDNQNLSIVIADISPSDAAALTGSGSSDLVHGAPELPQETGVSDYQKKRASATIIFIRSGVGYRPESVSIRVGTKPNFEWTLIGPTLVLKNLYAQLKIDSISKSAKLELKVHGDLLVQKSASKSEKVTVDLTATRQKLQLFVDMRLKPKKSTEDNAKQLVGLGGCNVTELLYMVTAGAVKLDLDVGPRLLTLDLELNWSEKKGSFTGTCSDWDLSSTYPDLAAMASPRIKLDVVKGRGLSGRLDGDFVLLSKHISMSYDLPRGPLRIGGVDVRDAVKLAKRLYKLVRRTADAVKKILKIISNITKAIKVAKAVGTALIALGATALVVWSLISSLFGGGGDDIDEPDHSELHRDWDHQHSAKWVVGGTGRSNGVMGETVTLLIYPKDDTKQDNHGELEVKIVAGEKKKTEGEESPLSTIKDFKRIPLGWSCQYTRPSMPGKYRIFVGFPADSLEFPCQVTTQARALGVQSILDVVGRMTTRRGYAVIWPRDTGDDPRFGHHADKEAFVVTLHHADTKLREQNPAGFPVSCFWLNDSIKVAYDPPKAGKFSIAVRLDGKHIKGSPADITVESVGDPDNSIAYGEGLCSGVAGAETEFTVLVRDQFGEDIVTTSVSCEAFLVEDLSSAILQPLTPKLGTSVFPYTRPTKVNEYSIRILVNNQALDISPIPLLTTKQRAMPSIENSTFSKPHAPYFVNSDLHGLIETNDQYGARYMTGGDTLFKVTVQKVGSEIKTPISLIDLLDGTYSIPLRFNGAGKWKIICNAPSDDQADGGLVKTEHEVEVLATPTLADIRCFGPGLSPGVRVGGVATSFNIQGLDHGGNIISVGDGKDFKVFMYLQQETVSRKVQNNMITVSYDRPAGSNASNVVCVLYKGAHVANSPFLVDNVPATRPTSPSKSIVKSEFHKIGELSTAIVAAVDEDGHRRFEGEDNITAKSEDPVLEVIDQKDGTYAVDYFPTTAKCTLNITINGKNIPPFVPEIPLPTPSVVCDPVIPSARLGAQATFDVQGVRSDQQAYKGRLVFTLTSTFVDVVDVDISATTNTGLRHVSYTVSQAVKAGRYLCKLFVLGLPEAEVPLFEIDVSSSPSFDVQGLDWYGATTSIGDSGVSGEFSVSWASAEHIKAADLVIYGVKATPEMPNEITPTFNVRADPTKAGKLNVGFTLRIGGVVTFNLKYGDQVIEAPKNGWRLYASDASQSIVHHNPSDVPLAWSTSSKEGIKASFDNDILVFRKTAKDDASNQWANATLSLPSLTIGEGLIVSYDVKWIDITNTSEAMMHSPVGLADGTTLLLRYHDGSISWVTRKSGLFTQSGASRISADGVWRAVLYHYTKDSVTVFEDGNLVLTKDVGPEHFQSLGFAMQSLDRGSTFHAQVRNVVTMPTAFHTNLPSLPTREKSTEIVFSAPSKAKSQLMWTTTGDNGLSVKYTSGSLQFFASNPKNSDFRWLKSNSRAHISPYTVTQYRFKINASQSRETRVTTMGNAVLRFADGAPRWWFEFESNTYTPLALSTAFTSGGEYVVVTVIANEKSMTYFENGRFLFTKTYTPGGHPLSAIFIVEYLEPDESTKVELSHFRGCSSATARIESQGVA